MSLITLREAFRSIPSDLVYRPLFNILSFFLRLFQSNLWFAIMALTIFVRVLTIKSTVAWQEMGKSMTSLQPRMKEIQEQYADNQQKLAEETMKLFKGEWWASSPLKGCIGMLIQIPLFLWVFWVVKAFASGETPDITSMYSFLQPFLTETINLENINHIFFGMDLFAQSTNHNMVLAILWWIFMYLQMQTTQMIRPQAANPQMEAMKNMNPNMPDMKNMMKYMNLVLVWSIVFFVFTTPAWVGLYIVTWTIFALTQFCVQYRQLVAVKLQSLFASKK